LELAIAQLRSEGYFFSDEDISRLSPTRYEHVNPYGIYLFDIEKESKRASLRPPKEKLDKIGQPSLVLGLELLIFRSWQAKRATY
jgi:hypothetical protein